MCAETLRSIDVMLKSSWLHKICFENAVPDLSAAADGEHVDEDSLEFLPLGKRRFLLAVWCIEGAYNVGYLVFAYDESRLVPARLTNYSTRPLPPLVVFPRVRPYAEFDYLPNKRDFDKRDAILYSLDKALGDGSGGIYAEYQINRDTFIPTLLRNIYKKEADHEDTYDFSRAMVPRGTDWHEDDVRGLPAGCLLTLKLASLPREQPDISCVGGRSVLR
jgi:hypothetical protein